MEHNQYKLLTTITYWQLGDERAGVHLAACRKGSMRMQRFYSLKRWKK